MRFLKVGLVSIFIMPILSFADSSVKKVFLMSGSIINKTPSQEVSLFTSYDRYITRIEYQGRVTSYTIKLFPDDKIRLELHEGSRIWMPLICSFDLFIQGGVITAILNADTLSEGRCTLNGDPNKDELTVTIN